MAMPEIELALEGLQASMADYIRSDPNSEGDPVAHRQSEKAVSKLIEGLRVSGGSAGCRQCAHTREFQCSRSQAPTPSA
jgi:hypothetical protein